MSSEKRVFSLPALIVAVLVAAVISAGLVLSFIYLSDRSTEVGDKPEGGEAVDLSVESPEAAGSLCYTEPSQTGSSASGNVICHEIKADKAYFGGVSSDSRTGTYAAGESIEFHLTLTSRHESSTKLQLDGAHLELNMPGARADLDEVRSRPSVVYACTDSIPAVCQISPFAKTMIFRYVVEPGHSAEALVVERLVINESDYVLGPAGENLLPGGKFLEIDQKFDFRIDTP